MGHLHPGCTKDIAVTMKSDVPINLKKMGIKCKLSKIMFPLPEDQVPDWDDRMRTVKWVDVPRTMPGTLTAKRKVSRDFKHKSDPACHSWMTAALKFSVSSFPSLMDLDFKIS